MRQRRSTFRRGQEDARIIFCALFLLSALFLNLLQPSSALSWTGDLLAIPGENLSPDTSPGGGETRPPSWIDDDGNGNEPSDTEPPDLPPLPSRPEPPPDLPPNEEPPEQPEPTPRERAAHKSNQGVAFWNQGDRRQAERAFKEALKTDPSYVDVHFNLAALYEEENRLEEALEHYRMAAALNPEDREALHAVGAIAYQLGRYDQAEEAYLRLIRLNPDDGDAHYNLGVISLLRNRPERAAASFQAAVRVDPDRVEALRSLAEIQLKQGYPNSAYMTVSDWLEREPENGEAHLLTGRVKEALGEEESAEEHYRAASLKPEARQAALAALMDFYSGRERWEEAIAAGEDLIASETNSDPALLKKTADLYYRAGRMNEALPLYQHALKMTSNAEQRLDLRLWMGYIHLARGELEAADGQFESALREPAVSGEKTGVMTRIAFLYRDAGQMKEALAMMSRAVSEEPGNAEHWINLGVIQQQAGRLDEAEESYREAIRLDSLSAPAYCNLGLVYNMKMNFPAAEEAFREALRLRPGYANAHYGLGRVHYRRQEYEAAAREFKEALRLAPEDEQAKEALARARDRLAESTSPSRIGE